MSEVLKKETECKPTEHRYFAVELIGNQAAQLVKLPIVCTQCGKLQIHVIDVN